MDKCVKSLVLETRIAGPSSSLGGGTIKKQLSKIPDSCFGCLPALLVPTKFYNKDTNNLIQYTPVRKLVKRLDLGSCV